MYGLRGYGLPGRSDRSIRVSGDDEFAPRAPVDASPAPPGLRNASPIRVQFGSPDSHDVALPGRCRC
jgi:hypothetical protein